MSVTESRPSREEIARLGAEILDRQVRPQLGPEDEEKFVAVDIKSGAFEVDADDYTAVMRLHHRVASAEVWLGRIGHRTAYRIRQSR